MADIFSRIVLQATGGDQVAREINKIKTAYKETGEASQNIGAGEGASSDPFSRAIGAPGASESARTRRQTNDIEQAKAKERLNQNYSVGDYGRSVVAGGTGSLSGMMRGDFFSTAAGASTGVQGLLKGGGALAKAVPWIAAASLGLYGMGKLAGNEWERVQGLWGTGVGQRLGMGYSGVRGLSIEQMRGGVPEEMVMAGLQSLGQAGGSMNQGIFQKNIRRMQLYGVSAEAGMGLSATLGRAGGSGTIDAGTYGILEKAFGAGRLTPLFQSIGKIIEDALAKGAKASAITLGGGIENAATAISRHLASYAQFGGLSMEGAIELYEQTQNLSRNTANIAKPLDVVTFRAFREGGESIFSTRLRMFQDPQAVLGRQMEMLEARFGGNSDLIKEALFKMGYTPSQAEALYQSRDALSKGEKVHRAPLREWETGLAGDEEAMKSYQVRQMQVLSGVEGAINKFHNDILDVAREIITEGLPTANSETSNKIVGELMTNNDIQRQILSGQISGYQEIVDAIDKSAAERAAQELTPQQQAAEAQRRAMSGVR